MLTRPRRSPSPQFAPADQPSCSDGFSLLQQPETLLAPASDCDWQGCWFGGGTGSCTNGTAQSVALCPDGTPNPRCCPYRRYVRCCRVLSCTARASPAGGCTAQQSDLLPGQSASTRLFAVPAATSDCWPYSYATLRTCGADRTWPAVGGSFTDCNTPTVVPRDADGCPKLPGYVLYRGWSVPSHASWAVDDGVRWDGVGAGAAAAAAAAARDAVLQAARCSASAACAAVLLPPRAANASSVAGGAWGTGLLSQLPAMGTWQRAAGSAADDPSSPDFCSGIYAKDPQPSTCPRVPGYLFAPYVTLATPDLTGAAKASAGNSSTAAMGGFLPSAAAGPCSNCGDAATLAARCDAAGSSCAGFSAYHGLISVLPPAAATRSAALLSDAPLAEFSASPCAGLFSRAARVFPAEVEAMDRLFCGQVRHGNTRGRGWAGLAAGCGLAAREGANCSCAWARGAAEGEAVWRQLALHTLIYSIHDNT